MVALTRDNFYIPKTDESYQRFVKSIPKEAVSKWVKEYLLTDEGMRLFRRVLNDDTLENALAVMCDKVLDIQYGRWLMVYDNPDHMVR